MTQFHLQPSPAFNPLLVEWGAPDQPLTQVCSYCRGPFGRRQEPLRFFRDDGWACAFCDKCAARLWGIKRVG